MKRLLVCPFCQEPCPPEATEQCPHCDLTLEPLRPPVDAFASSDEELDPIRSLSDFRQGRGLLLVVSALSLAAFSLCPWVEVTSPYTQSRTGLSLAQGPLGWLWGGSVGWFVALVLVFTRRTAHQMRGVRIILATFATLTIAESVVLLAFPPPASRLIHFEYSWAWGLWVSIGLAWIGLAGALFFGGKPPNTPTGPARSGHEVLH